MNKVICDICGTSYPETAEQCPICGFARDMGAAPVSEATVEEIPQQPVARQQVKGGRFSASNVRKRNKSTPRYQPQLTDDEDEEFVPQKPQKPKNESSDPNKPLVIILIILIAAVLVVSAFLFTKYALPAITGEDEEKTTRQTEDEPDDPERTEDPTIPCTALTLLDGTGKELTAEGQYWLLNVDIEPADTTDKVEFTSDNPDVAIVNEEGRIEAVGEGEAIIKVTCGEQEVQFTVVCVFEPETTAPTEPEPTEPEPTEPEPTEPEPTEPEPVTMTVNVSKLSIRSGAGTNNEKVGSYKKGEKVTIYEQVTVNNEKWGRTDKGWICIDYCK